MSVNLLDLAKGHLTNKVIGSLAGLLGEGEDKTQSAVSSIIPTLIGGLMKKSSTGEGASSLLSILDQEGDGILDDVLGLLGGGNHQGVLDKGNGILGSLFGGGLGGITDIIAKVSGLNRSSSGSLLGLLAPILMGVLSRVKKEKNLDAGGLASLLQDQGKFIKNDLPAGATDTLGLGSLLGSVGDKVSSTTSSATERVGNAVESAGSTVSSGAQAVGSATTHTAKQGGSLLGKLLPLVVLGGLAWLGWNFLNKGKTDETIETTEAVPAVEEVVVEETAVEENTIVAPEETVVTETVVDTSSEVVETVESAGETVVEGVQDAGSSALGGLKDMGSKLGDMTNGIEIPGFDISNPVEGMKGLFTNTGDVLGGITDASSATEALPQLEGVSDKLGLIGKIPGIGSKLGSLVGDNLGAVTGQVDRINGIPGLGDQVPSILGKIVSQLQNFIQ